MRWFYFAGAYSRRAELERYADEFVGLQLGFVASTWLTDPQDGLDAGFSADGLTTPETVAAAWKYGRRDIDDLSRSSAIVSFTGEGARGGRHIEHGWAMAWAMTMGSDTSRDGMRLIVVGPREHVFHCHPDTEVYPDFRAFVQHETERKATA